MAQYYHVWTNDLESKAYQDGLKLRQEVFIEEQKGPESLEISYEGLCDHLSLYLGDPTKDGFIVGTARLMDPARAGDTGLNFLKVQRVAVDKNWRGHGIGIALLYECESKALERGKASLLLDAQVQVIPFYEALGYRTISSDFIDAGIAHRKMIKKLVADV